ncbi:MAG: hypothetical protein NVSMB25_16830 [Thermoleophilaceae bacterium]
MAIVPIQSLLQIEATLLRRQLPDLLLKPGMVLAARVTERSGSHGVIVLAGAPLVAELPDDVKAGDRLRLAVQQSRADKVVLKLVPEQPLAPPPSAGLPLPLPGGMSAHVRVEERDADGGDSEHASIALVYDAPALGAVNLRLELAPGTVRVQAELRAGSAHALAEEGAHLLRDRLASATGRIAEVQVRPRYEPLDVYA